MNVEEKDQILLEYYQRLQQMKQINVEHDLSLVKKRFKKPSASKTILINFQRIAAILVIPLLIYSAWSIFSRSATNEKVALLKSSETAYGVRSQIQLSDGTKVWLNSGTKLTYPDEFNGQTREVKLEGEAYFQVESDSDHPFYVDLNGYKVKATGTRFNISNYSEDKDISAYLEHGKITLVTSVEGKPEVQLKQLNENDLLVLDKTQRLCSLQKVDGRKQTAWMEGALIFKNDNTTDVATRLGRWFNAEIVFDDDLQKSGYVFTATFKQESLEEALKLLSYSSPIKYKIISSSQLGDSTFSKRKIIISKK
jgi:ferric-dicitrate binding protein FerR (iron transport regulator)